MRNWLVFPIIGGALFLMLELIFVALRVPFWSWPLFCLGALVVIYVPGKVLLRGLNLKLSPLEDLALAWGAGYVGTTLFYFGCRALGAEPLYLLLIGLLFSYYIYDHWRRPTPGLVFPRDNFSWCFLATYVLVIAACGWLNFHTWVFQADGALRLATLIDRDSVFHVSLVQEMATAFPPHNPYAGNFLLRYHFFPELLASFFVRHLGILPWDLVARFFPVVNFSLLFLGVFIAARKLTGNSWVALSTVWGLNFLGNLGFWPQLIGQPLYHDYWEGYFAHHLMMLHMNPVQIAVTLFFLGLFSLAYYLENNQTAWFVLTALFWGLIAAYKVLVLPALLVGIAFPAFILWWRKKDWRLFYLLAAVLLLSLPLIFLLVGRSASNVGVSFKPWYLVYNTFLLRISPQSRINYPYARYFNWMFQSGWLSFLKYFLGAGLFFLVGSFWVRLMGLKKWLADLRQRQNPSGAILASTILAGVVLSMVITIPPEDFNSIYLLDFSVYLMTFYAAGAFWEIFVKRGRGGKIILTALFLTLSLPTTLQFLAPRPDPGTLPPDFVRLTKFLRQNVPPGSIIAHPLRSPEYILLPALGGGRSLAELVFPIENILGHSNTLALRRANVKIYATPDSAELQKIIAANHLDYILEDRYNHLAVRPDFLRPIYAQDGYVVNQRLAP